MFSTSLSPCPLPLSIHEAKDSSLLDGKQLLSSFSSHVADVCRPFPAFSPLVDLAFHSLERRRPMEAAWRRPSPACPNQSPTAWSLLMTGKEGEPVLQTASPSRLQTRRLLSSYTLTSARSNLASRLSEIVFVLPLLLLLLHKSIPVSDLSSIINAETLDGLRGSSFSFPSPRLQKRDLPLLRSPRPVRYKQKGNAKHKFP